MIGFISKTFNRKAAKEPIITEDKDPQVLVASRYGMDGLTYRQFLTDHGEALSPLVERRCRHEYMKARVARSKTP